MFSASRRRAALVAAAGPLMTLSLCAPSVAQADAPAANVPAKTTFTIQGCTFNVTAPSQDRPGHVAARASSAGCAGCANNWTFTAQLQSSRWWGWASDAKERWIGSAGRRLGAECAGVHDHRVILHWSSGPVSGTKIGRVSNLNCG